MYGYTRVRTQSWRHVRTTVLFSLLVLLLIVPIVQHVSVGQAATSGAATTPWTSGTYHFVGSDVAAAGQQVSHIEGILVLHVGGNGSFSGSTLRLSTGGTITVGNGGASGQSLSFVANGQTLIGSSTAVGPNRISGLFSSTSAGGAGFWVATRVSSTQMGNQFAFNGTLSSGPDAHTVYSGTLELWGDTFGGL